MNLPTTLALPAADVDLLREAAGQLLRESADYQSLPRDLGGSPRKQEGRAHCGSHPSCPAGLDS
jgi:hypothetical protein